MVTARSILHVDMDAFFASVELLRHPDLLGRPVVVGGAGERGVVAAASYPARVHGVRSAMATARARRLCPDLVVLPPDHGHYSQVSSRIMDTFREFTPLVEPLSLDEAFLDVTGASRSVGSAIEIAAELRRRIHERESLWCSVGVASSKLLAKLASEAAKPTPGAAGEPPGVVVVPADRELAFLQDRPVGDLWGVGPVTRERLASLGVLTVAQLAAFPVDALAGRLGAGTARHLHELANGRDDRPVVPDQAARSISQEETFARDLHSLDDLDVHLASMADRVAARARRSGVVGRTVQLKVRAGDLTTTSRSRTLDTPSADGLTILRVARALLADLPVSAGIRLLGVGLTNLLDDDVGHQLRIEGLDGPDDGRSSAPSANRLAATEAVDRVRARFGADAIGPARRPPPRGPAVADDTGGDPPTRGGPR